MSPTITPRESVHPEFAHESELEHLDLDAGRTGRSAIALVLAALAAFVAVLALAISIVTIATSGSGSPAPGAVAPPVVDAGASNAAVVASTAAPTLKQAAGVKYEPFKPVDASLPPIPAGAVKRFKVTAFEHVTQVDPKLAPTQVWSYAINGVAHRGTGLSATMVVEVGDRVEVTFINGGSRAMNVTLPHSLDYHSAETAPNVDYTDVAPGGRKTISFVANHPGVFMYHCATQPVLLHTGAGMVGAMVVKPKGLAPARELVLTQQEFYIGKAGGAPAMAKMNAKTPDVITFNGYANQYKERPITVRRGERVRMYVLNAGPSMWSAFHVIGTVFDRTVIEGQVGRHAQTVSLAPSQGGWVEFTLDKEGSYPFVTHAFGDMVKGALGVVRTENAPKAKAGAAH